MGNRWEAWLHLVRRLMDVQLSQQPDQLYWKLTKNSVFSVKSMYLDVKNRHMSRIDVSSASGYSNFRPRRRLHGLRFCEISIFSLKPWPR